jgi:acyl carrier protein
LCSFGDYMEPTIQNVKAFLEKSVGSPISSDSKSLFAQGLVDSFTSVELVVGLETAFSVKLSIFEFAEDNDFSVEQIASKIAKAKAAQ